MAKILKGTYKLRKQVKTKGSKTHKGVSDQFEAKAIEKLGGSIAFVSRSALLWKGTNEAETK